MKLELRGITKRFGSLVANDHIDLVVERDGIMQGLPADGAVHRTRIDVPVIQRAGERPGDGAFARA